MASDDIPFERIADTMDRSWTIRVANVLTDPFDPRYRVALSTLHHLEDAPAGPALTVMVLDLRLPIKTRLDASSVVRGWGYRPDSATVRSWWQDGDWVTQRHALLSMGSDESDIVLQVAADPSHSQHAAVAVLLNRRRADSRRFPRPAALARS